jgi:hypothetical protein
MRNMKKLIFVGLVVLGFAGNAMAKEEKPATKPQEVAEGGPCAAAPQGPVEPKGTGTPGNGNNTGTTDAKPAS